MSSTDRYKTIFQLAVEGTAQARDGVDVVDRSFKSLKNTVAGLAGGLTLGVAAGKLVSVQREFDVLNASLETVTGSSTAAQREFAWIEQFASTTPYQLQEVTGAFIKMKSLGLDASEDALRSYGNTASAMGKSLDQMIEAVADASTGEFERLKEFGIKARKQGDDVSLTFRGVTTTIKNDAAAITGYLQGLGNVDFAGAMERRANSLDGALSNLEDSWDGLFRTVGSLGVGELMADSARAGAQGLDALGKAIKDNKEEILLVLGAGAGAGLAASLPLIATGLRAVTVATLGLGATLAANPLTLALLGIGAVVGGAYAYEQSKFGSTLDEKVASIKKLQAEIARTEANLGNEFLSPFQKSEMRQGLEQRRAELLKLRTDVTMMEAEVGIDGEIARLQGAYNARTKPTRSGGGGGGKVAALSEEAKLRREVAELQANAYLADAEHFDDYVKRRNDEAREELELKRETYALQTEAYLADAQHYDEALAAEKRMAEIAREADERRREGIAESIADGILDGSRRGLDLMEIFLAELKAQFARTVLTPTIKPIVSAVDQLTNQAIGGLMGLFNGGGSSSAATVQTAGQLGDSFYSAFSQYAVPLATGTNYVPYDNFPALLHRGEKVVPAEYNPAAGGAGSTKVIINNYTGAQVEQTRSVDSRGQETIEVTLGRMVAGEMRRPGSAPHSAMRGAFGLAPALVGR